MSTLGGLSLDAAMFLQKRAASKLCVFGKSFLSEGLEGKSRTPSLVQLVIGRMDL